MKKIITTTLVYGGVSILVVLLIYNIISNYNFGNGSIPGSYFTIIKEPLFGGVVGLIVTLFIIDRWRKMEKDIDSVQKEQLDTLKKIRDDADNIIKGRLESTTRKANAIESKIGGLLEEHPWISSITENDLIPDASSCRIVLKTCQHLIKVDRIPLIYEYLYSWIGKEKNKERNSSLLLKGTIDDFLDLADFCEIILGDEFLSLQITIEGVSRASNRIYGYPDYLSKLVRNGHYEDAKSIAKHIVRQLPITISLGAKPFTYQPNKSMRASYIFNCYASLMLYYSLTNKKRQFELYKKLAIIHSKKINAITYLKCVEAESYSIMGEFQKSNQILEEILTSSNKVSQGIIYNCARIYRSIGDEKNFKRLIQKISNSEEDQDINNVTSETEIASQEQRNQAEIKEIVTEEIKENGSEKVDINSTTINL